MGWGCCGPMHFEILPRLMPRSRPIMAVHIPQGKPSSLCMPHVIATCVTYINRVSLILSSCSPRFSTFNTL